MRWIDTRILGYLSLSHAQHKTLTHTRKKKLFASRLVNGLLCLRSTRWIRTRCIPFVCSSNTEIVAFDSIFLLALHNYHFFSLSRMPLLNIQQFRMQFATEHLVFQNNMPIGAFYSIIFHLTRHPMPVQNHEQMMVW